MSVKIHPTAIVSPDAEIADGVVIGPYSIVDGNVTIGKNTELRPFVHIYPFAKIGENSIVYEHAVIAPEPQDLSFKGEDSWVTVGNHTVIRECVTIHRAAGEGNVTSVGDNCLIMESVHLGHNVHVADNVVISSKCGLAGYVEVGHATVIGGMSGFHQFVRIGSYCMIGGASRVPQDVPPFLLVNGSEKCRVYNLNVIGLRRHGFTQDQRLEMKRAYKKIYHSDLSLHEALDLLKDNPSPEVQEIVKFFREANKKRGYCPWPLRSSK